MIFFSYYWRLYKFLKLKEIFCVLWFKEIQKNIRIILKLISLKSFRIFWDCEGLRCLFSKLFCLKQKFNIFLNNRYLKLKKKNRHNLKFLAFKFYSFKIRFEIFVWFFKFSRSSLHEYPQIFDYWVVKWSFWFFFRKYFKILKLSTTKFSWKNTRVIL